MASFNKVILIGRLTADPELKTTPNGVPVTSFSIAVGRRFAKETPATIQTPFPGRNSSDLTFLFFRRNREIF